MRLSAGSLHFSIHDMTKHVVWVCLYNALISLAPISLYSGDLTRVKTLHNSCHSAMKRMEFITTITVSVLTVIISRIKNYNQISWILNLLTFFTELF